MKQFIGMIALVAFCMWRMTAYTADNHDLKPGQKEIGTNGKHKQHDEHEVHGEGEDQHGHGEDEPGEDEHGEDEHGEEGHDEHEEASSVGPTKGITEKAEAGFKLAPEALKTMGIQTIAITPSTMKIPNKAIVAIKNEKTVFRMRNGWFKRVKAEILKKESSTVLISTKAFRAGDQIVIEGSGFLRIAEIYAEEGASHSHAH